MARFAGLWSFRTLLALFLCWKGHLKTQWCSKAMGVMLPFGNPGSSLLSRQPVIPAHPELCPGSEQQVGPCSPHMEPTLRGWRHTLHFTFSSSSFLNIFKGLFTTRFDTESLKTPRSVQKMPWRPPLGWSQREADSKGRLLFGLEWLWGGEL